MALALFALFFASASAQSWGSICQNGQYVGGGAPDVAALQSKYPQLLAIADILPGDNGARARFQNITGAPLNIPVRPLAGTSPDMTGYDGANDPDAWWSATQNTVSKVPGIQPDLHTCSTPHTGPTCAGDQLYNQFAQNNILATLFYIGSSLATAPNQAKKAFAAGHEICVHTWSHHPMTTLTNEQAFAELYYTKMLINDILGVSTRCWRPPYGDVDDRIRFIAHSLELEAVIWDNDTNDWEGADLGNTDYAQILAKDYSQHGTMVLTHEVSAVTVGLWQSHFDQVKAVFSNIVPAVSGCGNITTPYADDDAPTYPKFTGIIAGQKPSALTSVDASAGGSGPLQFDGEDDFAAMLSGQPGLPQSTAASAASGPARAGGTGVVALASSTSAPSSVSTPPNAARSLAAPTMLVTLLGSALFVMSL